MSAPVHEAAPVDTGNVRQENPKLGIVYSKFASEIHLHAYADSNWSKMRSTSGYAIYLAGGLVSFASKKQRCIAMSSCEAELIALADCAIELLYVLGVLSDLGYEVEGPVIVYTDSKSAYDLCHRMSASSKTKHLDRKIYKMRELRGAGKVELRLIDSGHNKADIFTKTFKRQGFEALRSYACVPIKL